MPDAKDSGRRSVLDTLDRERLKELERSRNDRIERTLEKILDQLGELRDMVAGVENKLTEVEGKGELLAARVAALESKPPELAPRVEALEASKRKTWRVAAWVAGGGAGVIELIRILIQALT